MIHVTTQMNLQSLMVSEKSQTQKSTYQKATYYILLFILYPIKGIAVGKEHRLVVAWVGDWKGINNKGGNILMVMETIQYLFLYLVITHTHICRNSQNCVPEKNDFFLYVDYTSINLTQASKNSSTQGFLLLLKTVEFEVWLMDIFYFANEFLKIKIYLPFF